MNLRLFPSLALIAICSVRLFAQMLGPQTPNPAPVAAAGENASLSGSVESTAVHLTAQQLDQLLGPIALYPDALIALILPSATQPSDVVLAARYLADGEGAARLEDQAWDDSVKALAHYPDVVKWMDQNLAWTKQLGEVFLDQPAEVMKAVQRLRSAARAAGTLVDTPQQQVVTEADAISIVPSQPDVIYVPYYDPQIVYLPRRSYGYYPGSFFSFSVGYPVGFWLGYNLDWGHRRVVVVERHDRERYWRDQHDWRRPSLSSNFVGNTHSTFHPWQPNPTVTRTSRPEFRRTAPVVTTPSLTQPIPFGDISGRNAVANSISPDHTDRDDRRDRTTDRSDRNDRPAGSRDWTRRSPNSPNPVPPANSTPVVANTFQSSPAAGQVRSSSPAPAATVSAPAPASYSRGGRVGAANDSNSREANGGRSRDWTGRNENAARQSAPAVQASAPVPAPTSVRAAPAAAPRHEESHGESRSHRNETAAAAPTAASSTPASSSESSAEDRSRRVYSRGSRSE